jgi:hypothetical protein
MSLHHSGMVDLGNSFDASYSHAVEVHFETQLLDRSANTARGGNVPGTGDHSACICSIATLDDDHS